MLPMSEHGIKNEMRMYDNGRLFAHTDLPTNMINQEMMSFTPTSYEQQTDTVQNSAYNAKLSRLQYVTSPKISTQQETGYSKYNTGLFINQQRLMSSRLCCYRKSRINFIFNHQNHPLKLYYNRLICLITGRVNQKIFDSLSTHIVCLYSGYVFIKGNVDVFHVGSNDAHWGTSYISTNWQSYLLIALYWSLIIQWFKTSYSGLSARFPNVIKLKILRTLQAYYN